MGSWEVVKGFGTLLKDYVVDRVKGVISGITGLGSTLKKFFERDWSGAWETGKQAMLDLTGAQAKINLVKNANRLGKDWQKGYQKGLNSYKKDNPTDPETANAGVGNGSSVPGITPSSSTSISNIAGSGSGAKMRNVTVNIGKLVESIVVQNSGSTLDLDEIVAKVEEELIRSVRGSEQMLVNG